MNHALSHATPSFFPATLCKTLPFSLLRSLLSLPLLLVPVFSRQAVSCLQFVSRSRAYQISTGHTPIQNCRRSDNLHCLAKEGELTERKQLNVHSALPCLHFVSFNISILSLPRLFSLWTHFFLPSHSHPYVEVTAYTWMNCSVSRAPACTVNILRLCVKVNEEDHVIYYNRYVIIFSLRKKTKQEEVDCFLWFRQLASTITGSRSGYLQPYPLFILIL